MESSYGGMSRVHAKVINCWVNVCFSIFQDNLIKDFCCKLQMTLCFSIFQDNFNQRFLL